MLFEDAKFILICYSSNRNLIQESTQFNESYLGFKHRQKSVFWNPILLFISCVNLEKLPSLIHSYTGECRQDLFLWAFSPMCILSELDSPAKVLRYLTQSLIVKFSFLRIWTWAWRMAIPVGSSPEAAEWPPISSHVYIKIEETKLQIYRKKQRWKTARASLLSSYIVRSWFFSFL